MKWNLNTTKQIILVGLLVFFGVVLLSLNLWEEVDEIGDPSQLPPNFDLISINRFPPMNPKIAQNYSAILDIFAVRHVPSPMVSVIITSGRALECSLSAIESVMQQSLTRVEQIEILFVVSPHTLEQVEPRFDALKKMHLILPYNVGMTIFRFRSYEFAPPVSMRYSRAGYFRTAALLHSRGRYISFLDDDDCWASIKLEMQLLAMRAADAVICATDAFNWHRASDCANRSSLLGTKFCACPIASQGYHNFFEGQVRQLEDKTGYKFHDPIMRLNAMQKSNLLIASTVTMDGDLARSLLPMMPIEDNSYEGEDYHMWRRALEYLEANDPDRALVLYIHYPLVYYDKSHGRIPADL